METKLVRVPFEVELAKKITNGEVEGRIVTMRGDNVRIVCWNYKSMSGDYPILALVDEKSQEEVIPYSECGIYNVHGYFSEDCLDLMLKIPEYLTFKDGDVVSFGLDEDLIGVFKSFDCNRKGVFSSYVTLVDDDLTFYETGWVENNFRKATKEEKQKLITALKESKDPKAKEYLKRFFGIEQKQEHEFKPFDKVICRDDYSEWFVDMFSHIDKNGLYACIGHVWNYCIPYNDQTAHLLGTTEDYNG